MVEGGIDTSEKVKVAMMGVEDVPALLTMVSDRVKDSNPLEVVVGGSSALGGLLALDAGGDTDDVGREGGVNGGVG